MPLSKIEKQRAYSNAWHKSERGKSVLKIWRKKRYLKKREEILASNKKWQSENQDIVRKIKQRYKAKRNNLIKAPSIQILNSVYEKSMGGNGSLICILCLKPVSKETISLEHITPITRGGDNTPENLWIAHRNCNSSKNNKMLWEYRLCHLVA